MTYHNETYCIDDLLDGGNHMDNVPHCNRQNRRRARRTTGAPLPFEVMLEYIKEQGYERPTGGRSKLY
jgi:hypothetical protein